MQCRSITRLAVVQETQVCLGHGGVHTCKTSVAFWAPAAMPLVWYTLEISLAARGTIAKVEGPLYEGSESI